MYYVYILFNRITSRYYIGYTPDLRKRIQRHRLGKVQSTKSNLNYQLVFYASFLKRQDATSFEKYLKSGSGVAFMRKRFLKSFGALVKDKSKGKLATRSSKSVV